MCILSTENVFELDTPFFNEAMVCSKDRRRSSIFFLLSGKKFSHLRVKSMRNYSFCIREFLQRTPRNDKNSIKCNELLKTSEIASDSTKK